MSGGFVMQTPSPSDNPSGNLKKWYVCLWFYMDVNVWLSMAHDLKDGKTANGVWRTLIWPETSLPNEGFRS